MCDLLARCGDEFLSPADAAVIASRFANTLTADLIVRAPMDVAVDCRAFAEGAVIAARRASWAWSIPALTVVAELAAHHGLEAFSEAAQQLYLRDSRSSNSITLWAESAATPREVVQRYLHAAAEALSPDEVEALMLRYVEHSPYRADLQALLH